MFKSILRVDIIFKARSILVHSGVTSLPPLPIVYFLYSCRVVNLANFISFSTWFEQSCCNCLTTTSEMAEQMCSTVEWSNGANRNQSSCFKFLLKKAFCDCTLKTDDGKEIFAHRIILASTSLFFRVFVQLRCLWLQTNNLLSFQRKSSKSALTRKLVKSSAFPTSAT